MDAAIQTSAKVMLFFRGYHDEKNTIESELKKIEAFRAKVQDKLVCVDYNNKSDFEAALAAVLSKQE